MGLHNFICHHNFQDSDFDNINIENDDKKAQNIENNEHDEDNILSGEEESEAGTYMQIVYYQIAEQIWTVNQHRSRRLY